MPTALIIGGSGKVARHLTTLLVSKSHTVHSIIRNPEQVTALTALGTKPIVQSIEDASIADLTRTILDVKPDVTIWSAGAGGGNPERTVSVDHQGAVKVMDALAAAVQAGGASKRFILVSAVDVRDRSKPAPAWYDEKDRQTSDRVWQAIGVYMQAKFEADKELVTGNARRGLEYTIVRPSGLTMDKGVGTVAAGKVHIYHPISREDVAGFVEAVWRNGGTINRALDVVGGDTPIDEAVEKVVQDKVDCFEGHY